MKIEDSLKISVTALVSHKTRGFLASVGILIGIASVIVMVAIGEGSQKEVLDIISQMGENLITVNAGEMKRRGGHLRLTGTVTNLTVRDARFLLDEIGELSAAAPYEYKETKVRYRNSLTAVTVSGSTLEFLPIRKYKISGGRFFDERDLKLARRVAVLGTTTVKNIFGDEDPLGRIVRVESVPFEVIGVFESKGMDADGMDQDEIMLIPLTTLMRRLLNRTWIRTIYFQAASREAMGPAVRKIRDLLRQRHKLPEDRADDFTIQSQLELERLKRETSELFTLLITGVAAISLVVGGIGILAVMLASVKERTREIGIRRAVGASRTDIVRQFLLESVLIGLFGGGIGIALGVGIAWALTRWGPWTLIVEPGSIVLATGVCLLVGVLFGLVPAVKAARLDPMEALVVE